MASMNYVCDLDCSPYVHHSPKSESDQEVFGAETTKGRYNSGVLIADWFEKRAKYTPPKNDYHTVNGQTYTCKTNNNFEMDRATSKVNKAKIERGLGGEILIQHRGDAFHSNYSTTSDLFYRVIPRGLCGPRIRHYSSRLRLWVPETDLTNNYGNLTTYSPPYYCKYLAQQSCPVTRFIKPKGITNEPYLAHLDIDPDLPFRPHLTKTKDCDQK